MDRNQQIIRTSIINIVGNLTLSIVKGIVGAMTGSIAIILDAVNSLTDALTSVVAIIGTRIASKAADTKHPFGYGRVEYLTSVVIAGLILAAGISSFREAVDSLINPTTPQYTVVTLVVVALAALVKFGLGTYLMRQGKVLNSGSLLGSGTDSMMDGGVSVATCVAGILYLVFGLQIESLLAAGISILITKNGINILVETASKLLGERVDTKIAAKVEQAARSVKQVRLASGVMLQDYGPDDVRGTLHVTVDENMTIAEFDTVARAVQRRVREKCGVIIMGVTPYPDVVDDEDVRKIRSMVGSIVWKHDHVVELRGLYVNPKTSTVRFDAIADFATEDMGVLRKQITSACEKKCPGWTFDVRVLPDVTD